MLDRTDRILDLLARLLELSGRPLDRSLGLERQFFVAPPDVFFSWPFVICALFLILFVTLMRCP